MINPIRRLFPVGASLVAVVLALAFTPVLFAAVTDVSHWRMGEQDSGAAAGVVTNSTTDPTGSRTITLIGSPSYSSGVSPVATTAIGSALCMSFPTGSYGTIASMPSLTENFGMEVWVKPNDTAGNK